MEFIKDRKLKSYFFIKLDDLEISMRKLFDDFFQELLTDLESSINKEAFTDLKIELDDVKVASTPRQIRKDILGYTSFITEGLPDFENSEDLENLMV